MYRKWMCLLAVVSSLFFGCNEGEKGTREILVLLGHVGRRASQLGHVGRRASQGRVGRRARKVIRA
jgi:hypothetical protein